MIVTPNTIFLNYSPRVMPRDYLLVTRDFLLERGWSETGGREKATYFGPRHSFPQMLEYITFSEEQYGGSVQVELPEINPRGTEPVTGEESKLFKTLLGLLQPNSITDFENQPLSPIDLVV